jgi:hypothetical protein
MPRRAATPRLHTPAAPRPEPQHIRDENYVQPARLEFGRTYWYNPANIKPTLAAIIRRSSLYAGLGVMEREWTERCLSRWEDPSSSGSNDLDLRTEKAWGVGVDISFNFRHAGERERVEDPETGGYFFVMPMALSIKVNWSSTGRSLITAQASIMLYQEAVNLGCLVAAKAEEYEGKTASIFKMVPNPAYVAPVEEPAE